jgi:hypothetical protein
MSVGKEVFIAAIIILTFIVIAVSVISAVAQSWPTLPPARAQIVPVTEAPRAQQTVPIPVPTHEGIYLRTTATTLATPLPSSTPQPAPASPRYTSGDVVSSTPAGATQGDLILSYSSSTDKYRVQVVYVRGGEWVCLDWDPTIQDRTSEESARPYKVDKINPDYLARS